MAATSAEKKDSDAINTCVRAEFNSGGDEKDRIQFLIQALLNLRQLGPCTSKSKVG